MPADFENSAVATGLKKVICIPIPKKGNAKERSNYRRIVLTSHASKVMLKILQVRLQQYFSSPVATAEFSKFAGISSAALSQHHLSGFETAQLEFHHLY